MLVSTHQSAATGPLPALISHLSRGNCILCVCGVVGVGVCERACVRVLTFWFCQFSSGD